MNIKKIISIIIIVLLSISVFSSLKNSLFKRNILKMEALINRTMNYKVSLEPTPKEAILDEGVLFSFGDNNVVITKDSIAINAVEFGGELLNPKGLVLDSTNYPKLFEPKDDSRRIHVKEISGGDKSETKLLFISRQIFSHGAMMDYDYVIFDPEIGKVVDIGSNSLFGNLHFNNSCTSCDLPVLLFREYNRQQQKFVLTNNQHKKEFVDLLKQYEDRGSKEYCLFNGKNILINELIKTANDSDKCSDFNDPDDKPPESFITVGEYKQIIHNIKEIINGKNIEMVDNSKYYGEGLHPLKI